MEAQKIKEHWANWASEYGVSIRATTLAETAKTLEIDVLARRLHTIPNKYAHVLDVGCGNGINCVELSKLFPQMRFDGIDYVADMIVAANEAARMANVKDRIRFFHTDLFDWRKGSDKYDVVVTDRCLINLNTVALQRKAIKILASKLVEDGHLLMIENSLTMRERQNDLREMLGLSRRRPAPFNLFFKEDELRSHIKAAGLELLEIEDFSSLHDLMLYVLIPALTRSSEIDYEHPLVKIATELSLKAADMSFGSFGQNRLFICRK